MKTQPPRALLDWKYGLSLKSGRSANLTALMQLQTYELLLTGFPDRSLNQRLVEHHLSLAKKWSGSLSPLDLKPVLIPPPISACTHPPESVAIDLRGPCEVMPRIVSIGLFDSDGIDIRHMCSSVLLVWYQDWWGLPTWKVHHELSKLDWEAHACGWDL